MGGALRGRMIVAGAQGDIAHAELAFQHHALFVTLMIVTGQAHSGLSAQQKRFEAGAFVDAQPFHFKAGHQLLPTLGAEQGNEVAGPAAARRTRSSTLARKSCGGGTSGPASSSASSASASMPTTTTRSVKSVKK